MARNQGITSLKRRRRTASPMQEYDRLPPELRAWLSSAILPWSPRSVRRAYKRALFRTRDADLAIGELEQMQRRNVAKDANFVWGPDHALAAKDAHQRDASPQRF